MTAAIRRLPTGLSIASRHVGRTVSRRRRRWIALFALIGLLFQQVAMAAYVCPIEARYGLAAAAGGESPPCHRQDGADRARCHQHCHPIAGATDAGSTLTVPPALVPSTSWLPVAVEPVDPLGGDAATDVVAHAGAPPVTIRDCTFQL